MQKKILGGLALLTFVSALAVVAVAGRSKARALRDGARIVQVHLQRAEMEAIAQRRPMLVRFYTARRKGAQVVLWRVQVVASSGDKPSFLPWPEGGNPDPDHPPPQPGPNGKDETVLAEAELPEGIAFLPGRRAQGNPMPRVAFMCWPDRRVELWLNDFSQLVQDVSLDSFKDGSDPSRGPANCHDFAVQDGQGQAIYFALSPITGRLIYKESLKQETLILRR